MQTVHRFRHPLTGEVFEHALPAPGRKQRGGVDYRALALPVVLALVVALTVAGFYAFRFYARWSQATAAIKAAQETIVYEPLSKVDDGSYEALEGAADRRSIRVLRRLRRR